MKTKLGMAAARAARDAAVTAVARAANPTWSEVALRAAAYVAHNHPDFISDDVWDALARSYPDITTHEPRAMAGVLNKAVKLGYCELKKCEHCGTTKVMRPGRRAQGHATDMPVYISLLHARAASPSTAKRPV